MVLLLDRYFCRSVGMNRQNITFRNQIDQEIKQTVETLTKLPKQYIYVTGFVKYRLAAIVEKFLRTFGMSYEKVSHIDFPNLVGDLLLKYYELEEKFPEVKYTYSTWSKRRYMDTALTRETNRLLKKELKYMIKKPLTKTEKTQGLKRRDKELPVSPEQVFEERHSNMVEERVLISKMVQDLELWGKEKLNGKQWEILRLLVGRNSIRQIAEMTGQEYHTVYMAARRMADIIAMKL